jgi:antitoxin (DNA-binding transcriptional repressor) of toxin-antitoxin stability system
MVAGIPAPAVAQPCGAVVDPAADFDAFVEELRRQTSAALGPARDPESRDCGLVPARCPPRPPYPSCRGPPHDRVRSGEELVVTDRGRAIARVVPLRAERALDRLIAQGVVTPAHQPKRRTPTPIKTKGTVSDLVAEQRR